QGEDSAAGAFFRQRFGLGQSSKRGNDGNGFSSGHRRQLGFGEKGPGRVPVRQYFAMPNDIADHQSARRRNRSNGWSLYGNGLEEDLGWQIELGNQRRCFVGN